MPKDNNGIWFSEREREFVKLYVGNPRLGDQLVLHWIKQDIEDNGVPYTHTPKDKEEYLSAAAAKRMDLENYINEDNNTISHELFEADVRDALQESVNRKVYKIKNRFLFRKMFKSDAKKIKSEYGNGYWGITERQLALAKKAFPKMKWRNRLISLRRWAIYLAIPLAVWASPPYKYYMKWRYGEKPGHIKVKVVEKITGVK